MNSNIHPLPSGNDGSKPINNNIQLPSIKLMIPQQQGGNHVMVNQLHSQQQHYSNNVPQMYPYQQQVSYYQVPPQNQVNGYPVMNHKGSLPPQNMSAQQISAQNMSAQQMYPVPMQNRNKNMYVMPGPYHVPNIPYQQHIPASMPIRRQLAPISSNGADIQFSGFKNGQRIGNDFGPNQYTVGGVNSSNINVNTDSSNSYSVNSPETKKTAGNDAAFDSAQHYGQPVVKPRVADTLISAHEAVGSKPGRKLKESRSLSPVQALRKAEKRKYNKVGQVLDTKSQVFDNRNKVLGSKTQGLGNPTQVVGNPTQLLDTKSKSLDNKTQKETKTAKTTSPDATLSPVLLENRSKSPLSNPKKAKLRIMSCNNCRIRKIKCDNKFPCGACVKAKVSPDLCSYDSLPWVSLAQQQQKFTQELNELQEENKALLTQLHYYKDIVDKHDSFANRDKFFWHHNSKFDVGDFAALLDPSDDKFIFSMNELRSRYSTLISYVKGKNTVLVPASKHLDVAPHLFFGPFHFRSLLDGKSFMTKIYNDLFHKSSSSNETNLYQDFVDKYETQSKDIENSNINNNVQIVIKKFNILINNPYHIRKLFENFFYGIGSFFVDDLFDKEIAFTIFSKYFNIDLESYDEDKGDVEIVLCKEMEASVNTEEIIYKLLDTTLILVISVMLGNTSDMENEELTAILGKYRPTTEVIDLFITESLRYTSYKKTPSYYAIKLFISWSKFKQLSQNSVTGFDSDVQYFFDILNTISLAKNESYAMGLHCDIDELYGDYVDNNIKAMLKQIFKSILEIDISIIVYTGQPMFIEYKEKINYNSLGAEETDSKESSGDANDAFILFVKGLINDMTNLGDLPSFYHINRIQNFLAAHSDLLLTGKLDQLNDSKMSNRDIFKLMKNFRNGFYLVNLLANLFQNVERLMIDLNYPYKEPLKYEKTRALSLQWTCLLMLLIKEAIKIFDLLIKNYKFDPYFKMIFVNDLKYSMLRCVMYIGKLVYNTLRSMLSGLFKVEAPTSPDITIDKMSFEDLYAIYDGSEENFEFLRKTFHKSQIKRLLFFTIKCLEELVTFPPGAQFDSFKDIAFLMKNILWFVNNNFKVDRCFNELDAEQEDYLSETVNEQTLKETNINMNFFK